MAEQRIVVEIDLRIEAQDLSLARHDQGIDFEKAHILGKEGPVELLGQPAEMFGLLPFELQCRGKPPADIAAVAGWADSNGCDLLRCRARHLFDIDAAFFRSDERHPRRCPVDKTGKIMFPRDVRGLLDIDAVDDLALGAGLLGHELHAEHPLGLGANLLERLHQLDPARLAAAARMDLRLDHNRPLAEPLRRLDGFFRRERRRALGHCHAEFPEHRLRLILVNVHRQCFLCWRTRAKAQFARSGAIFLAASISPCTALTEFLNWAFSSPSSLISTMRSTPPAPITTGTPTNTLSKPYCPVSLAAQGSTRFLSLR